MRWPPGRPIPPGRLVRIWKYLRDEEYYRPAEKEKARRTIARFLEDMDDEMEALDMLGLL